MKTKILLFGLCLSLLTVGCSKKDDNANDNITAEEVGLNAKIDASNNDVQNLVENEFDATNVSGLTGKNEFEAQSSALPTCVTVTRVPAFGTMPTVGQVVTKTIDFGTAGCPLPNGNVLKGKIIITFTYNPTATTNTINYQFVNFYHNAIKFDGNKSFTRSLSVATATSPAHPIVVMNMDMTATFPNGKVVTRTGTRTREIIEGFNTPAILDNVWQITGNWTTTFPNTTVQTSTITTPLIVKANCPNIVKGVITFVRGNNTATLNYGNGDCDNQAVFTLNGVATNITLGN
jgi:hypothetical protein